MTRRIMLARAHGNLMLEEGDALLAWAGPNEEYDLDDAADETAQATDCYTAEQIDTLTINQAEYCFPKIYKPKRWYAVDENGNRRVLVPATAAQLDRCEAGFGFTNTGTGETGWRTWTSQDVPTYRVMDGLTSFIAAPVAKATRVGGIIIGGFALSTLPATGRERHQWDLPGDECPLPEIAHNAVVELLTAKLCRRMKVRNREYRQMEIDYRESWRMLCGDIATWAAKNYRGGR